MSVRVPRQTRCSGPVNTAVARDPVCGTPVSETTPFTTEVGGHPYYFCSQDCLDTFQQSLQAHDVAHMDAELAEATQCDANLSYISHSCPMHPQITQAGPGRCPRCGMALEPIR